MILTIDIGNTYTKIAVFDDEKLLLSDRREHLTAEYLNSLSEKYGRLQAIVSSVSADKRSETEYILTLSGIEYHSINHKSPLPFAIDYETPETLGNDRMAAMAGCIALNGNRDYMVIDAGSCVTYDLLIDNHFIGGNIAPGLQMRLDAMHRLTAALPQLTAEEPNVRIGKTTRTAMICGAYWGLIYEIETIVLRYRAEYPDICVIATGGDSETLAKHISGITVEKHLVHKGLNLIAKKLSNEKR